MATWAVKRKGRSIGSACDMFGLSQTCDAYWPKLPDQQG
jgi:hypothetical protein